MVADAMCLWTATVLPALGPVETRADSAHGGPKGAWRADRRDSDHTGPRDRPMSHQGRRKLPSDRAGRPPLKSIPARNRRCGFPLSPERRRLHSLSHLSLTLWCMAPRSGWLGGCAPLHQVLSEPNEFTKPPNDFERWQKRRCREERTGIRPSPSATHRSLPVLT
jgi:hypothetical protein